MKIIFSRKGFDSTAGGSPSLIFPDGTLFSIPIPSSKDDYCYSELSFQYQGDSIQSILNEITGKRIKHNKQRIDCDFSLKQQRCHYDPMPIHQANRLVLGQTGNAEIHLQNQSVGIGDIFLFYGWFRQVEKKDGRWQYLPSSRDIHLIWSWMTIGEAFGLGTQSQREQAKVNYQFLHRHPHLADWREAPNRIYISKEGDLLPYSTFRCLTECMEYRGRSTWRLPACFNQPQAFTFLKNFILDGDDVIISYQGYGQEFVLDLDMVSSENDRVEILTYMNQNILGGSEQSVP
jgi:hypothetical protein